MAGGGRSESAARSGVESGAVEAGDLALVFALCDKIGEDRPAREPRGDFFPGLDLHGVEIGRGAQTQIQSLGVDALELPRIAKGGDGALNAGESRHAVNAHLRRRLRDGKSA